MTSDNVTTKGGDAPVWAIPAAFLTCGGCSLSVVSSSAEMVTVKHEPTCGSYHGNRVTLTRRQHNGADALVLSLAGQDAGEGK